VAVVVLVIMAALVGRERPVVRYGPTRLHGHVNAHGRVLECRPNRSPYRVKLQTMA